MNFSLLHSQSTSCHSRWSWWSTLNCSYTPGLTLSQKVLELFRGLIFILWITCACVTVIALNCPYMKQKEYFRDDLRWTLLWPDMIWTMTLHTTTTGILLKRLIVCLKCSLNGVTILAFAGLVYFWLAK